MDSITPHYLTRAELWICITMVLYFLMNGAQIFETLVFVPKWTASPPDNFKMLLDEKGTSLKVFWIVLHSLHEVAFILTLIFCWKVAPVRYWLLILFILHFIVRIWTLVYFAPNIINFQKMATDSSFTKDVVQRVINWQTWNYVRVAVYIMLSLAFIPLLVKVSAMRINVPV